jgi:hypothetical protein
VPADSTTSFKGWRRDFLRPAAGRLCLPAAGAGYNKSLGINRLQFFSQLEVLFVLDKLCYGADAHDMIDLVDRPDHVPVYLVVTDVTYEHPSIFR